MISIPCQPMLPLPVKVSLNGKGRLNLPSGLAGGVELLTFIIIILSLLLRDQLWAPLNAVSTSKLAQVKHMLYEQNNHLLSLEEELKKEKKKVETLEVNNKDMMEGIIHPIEHHIGPSEKAIRGVTTSLLPLLFGCQSEVFRC